MHKNSFFWEKTARKRAKGRFNLLLLDYGEYFVEDVGVFCYPVPDETIGRDFFQCDALKTPGRMKLCTKSFIFEPSDPRKPLVKYPFKNMRSGVSEFSLSSPQKRQCTIEASGFFTFLCGTVFEMKENDKIGPYRQIDGIDPRVPTQYLFAVSHTNIGVLLTKMAKLREIYESNEKGSVDAVHRLLAEVTNALSTAAFDSSKLIDFHEKLVMDDPIAVKRIRPMIQSPGHLMLTDVRLYFQPSQLNNVGESTCHYDLSNVIRLYKRRYLLMDTALELIMLDGESILFCFESRSSRDYIHDVVASEPHLSAARVTLREMTERWKRRDVSNFDYLMFVNNEAGRSLSDLAQYPVYPHVLADYTSKSLDLTNPATFRDLSKPVGALNPQRLSFFRERMLSMPPEDKELGVPPRFLYGTHYSTPGYVLYYLVRVAPEHMLCLQSGKFDSTDRMFISLADSWESCLNNPADLKELIPEFFCGKSGEFLVNVLDLDLGRRHTGEKLHDVELPPWAKSPKDFMKKHTKALESDYVSDHIHEWIDLIFGVAQNGPLAEERDNLFYHLTYEGAVDMDSVTDIRERRALEVQIQEFGQTPRQVFFEPHPRRDAPSGDTPIRPHDIGPSTPEVSTLSLKLDTPLVYRPHQYDVSEEASSASRSVNPERTAAPLIASSALGADGPPAPPVEEDDLVDLPAVQDVMELGPDFQEEVERMLKAEQNNCEFVSTVTMCSSAESDNVGEGPAMAPSNVVSRPASSSYLAGWVGAKLGGLWSAAVGSVSPGALASEVALAPPADNIKNADATESAVIPNQHGINRMKLNVSGTSAVTKAVDTTCTPLPGRSAHSLSLLPSEPFQAHSEAVTSACISTDCRSIITCSKDSTAKILRVSCLEATKHSSLVNIQMSVRRSFAPSDPPLSGCCVVSGPDTAAAGESKFVLVSSWDSAIYSYSIPNACVVAKKVAHDDGISALSYDMRGGTVVSGSWDASVKVWSVNPSSGTISSTPEAELFDHDTPVQCVAMDRTCVYLAAGAEDGRVCIWKKNGSRSPMNLLLSKQIGAAGRSVSSLHWVDVKGHSAAILLCSSIDGNVCYIDISTCDVAASCLIDSGVRCISCDPRGTISGDLGLGVYIGCVDGSLRLLALTREKFKQIEIHKSIHQGGVSSLHVSDSGNLLVSAGEDGGVRVWTVRTTPLG